MAIPVSHTDCIDHFLEYLVRGKLPSSILPSDSGNTDPVKFRTPIKTTAYMFLRPRVRAYIYRIVRKKTPPLGVNFCAELFFQTRRGTQTKCWLWNGLDEIFPYDASFGVWIFVVVETSSFEGVWYLADCIIRLVFERCQRSQHTVWFGDRDVSVWLVAGALTEKATGPRNSARPLVEGPQRHNVLRLEPHRLAPCTRGGC